MQSGFISLARSTELYRDAGAAAADLPLSTEARRDIHMSASKQARKFFLCTGECVKASQLRDYPNSHIIGELRYLSDDGLNVTSLARWEISISTSAAVPINPEVDIDVIGDARNIKCRYPRCRNKKKDWKIGRAALVQLSHRYQL